MFANAPQLNEYGFLSGGFIFDYADRAAHSTAKKYLGDCMTANATINYISPLEFEEGYGVIPSIQFNTGNKIGVSIRIETDDNRVIATASFLFIKTK